MGLVLCVCVCAISHSVVVSNHEWERMCQSGVHVDGFGSFLLQIFMQQCNVRHCLQELPLCICSSEDACFMHCHVLGK